MTTENQLQILDKREEGLKVMASEFGALKINGIEDKEGFTKVSEARKKLKAERVQIEKDAKELREGAVKFQKTVIARERELIAIIEPTEDSLYNEEKAIEDQKEAIKKEKERKEAERVQSRVNALSKFSFAIDYVEARGLTDAQFNERLTQAEIDYNQEQERKAAEELARKQEEHRLIEERAEIDRIRKEQYAAQAALKEEQARIEKERYDEYARITEERNRLDCERKAYEDQKAREEAEKKRLVELEQARIDAVEKARIEAEAKIIREAKEKEERGIAAKAELARQEALKPDKEKLSDFYDRLLSVDMPVVSDESAKQIVDVVRLRIADIRSFLLQEIKSL